MKKKIILPMILACAAQMPLMAMDQAAPQPNQNNPADANAMADKSADENQAGTSWANVGLYSAGTALGVFGLVKGYKWLTDKKPVVPPTIFEKLAVQLPGGDAILKTAQTGTAFAKNHKYITGACALAVAGFAGYQFIIEPGLQVERDEALKYHLTRICNFSYSVAGPNAFGQVCEHVRMIADDYKDESIFEGVNDLLDYYANNTGTKAPKNKQTLGAFKKKLADKKRALFEQIDEMSV